jgi:geranylgeranyl transferase type-1 subunit beta
MRFVYCACAIKYLLQADESIFNVPKTLRFIMSSFVSEGRKLSIACVQNYDGGIGQAPCVESHGGSTYCAVASLHLLHRLHDAQVLPKLNRDRLIAWCVHRQCAGLHGRANKRDDSLDKRRKCICGWV